MEFTTFGSRDYCLMVLLLAFARGMDFLSTWVATPNLVLEGNPVAKLLGWRWGALPVPGTAGSPSAAPPGVSWLFMDDVTKPDRA